MSYSSELKKSFFGKKIKQCCLKAMLCGMIAFAPEDGGNIRISSEYGELLEYYAFLFEKVMLCRFEICKNGRLKYIEIPANTAQSLREKIGFGKNTAEGLSCASPKSGCCYSSFLRGVFLTAGSVSSPDAAFRLEFRVHTEKNAAALLEILNRAGLEFKKSVRKNKPIIYTASADTIRDFLSETGAVDFMFDYANASIEKKLRNDVNRHSNCDSANIDRVIGAAASSVKAIDFLEKNGLFDKLDRELKEIALLRKKDDTDTLAQLGKKCDPPISKAQACRRIKKICAIAEKYEREGKI